MQERNTVSGRTSSTRGTSMKAPPRRAKVARAAAGSTRRRARGGGIPPAPRRASPAKGRAGCGQSAVPAEQSDNPAPGAPKPTYREQLRRILAAAETTTVRLAEVDLADRRYSHRDRIVPPCDADALLVQDGLVDFSGGADAAVLLAQGDKHIVVRAFGRIEALGDRRDVKRVRCKVVRDPTEARLITSCSNLSHGIPLTPAEKQRQLIALAEWCEASGSKLVGK